jgi:NADH dehydrogenase
VVVVGGGFGGLRAAKALARLPLEVTLVDRRNFHLFQPLLYQVATGALSPANIATPLRKALRRRRNVRVILAEATGVDAAGRRLLLADGAVAYDFLVVAAGARSHYFDRPEWAERAPGLKSLEDATEVRRRILLAFERAERTRDPEEIRAALTFVVVGGGATGVEMAGALAEISRDTLRTDFRRIDPGAARILLVEGGDRVLGAFPEPLSRRAEGFLARLGVTVIPSARVAAVEEGAVVLRRDGTEERIPTRTVLWAAGVRGEAFGEVLARDAGATLDERGRVVVGPDLSMPGRPEVLVLGDLARFEGPGGEPLPGVAPVAMQQGSHAARVIRARLDGLPAPPFRYRDPGTMATVGRSAAVADFGRVRLHGCIAWVAWLFVHLLQIAEHENRVLVSIQWAWSWFTFNRSARLITGEGAEHPRREEPRPPRS